jgi:hypothetical protein
LRILATFAGICVFFSANLNTEASPRADARAERLEAFFKHYRCPQPFQVNEYLHAADVYGIDYRLLPALSVRESTCGWYAHGNNRWGWNSARTDFASVEHGIRFIASVLSRGRRYRGKDLNQKLHTYNPLPDYATEVRWIMSQVESDEPRRLESEFQPENARLALRDSREGAGALCASDPPPPARLRVWWRSPPCPFR